MNNMFYKRTLPVSETTDKSFHGKTPGDKNLN